MDSSCPETKELNLQWPSQAWVAEAPREVIFIGPLSKAFFPLVLLFPLTGITVLLSSTVLLSHYPAAAHPAGERCLFLMVLHRHTNPPQPRGMHPKRYMGIYFLPPAGACSRADPTELLAVTKPRERCVHTSWAAKPYHLAQGSRVQHRYFKISP